MDEIRFDKGLTLPESPARKATQGASPAGAFSEALRNAVDDVSQLQNNADKAVMNVQTGKTGHLHEAMIALEKADIAFRTMLQVRNKMIEAYQEVMRMQV